MRMALIVCSAMDHFSASTTEVSQFCSVYDYSFQETRQLPKMFAIPITAFVRW